MPVMFGPNIRGNWSFNYASDAGAPAYDAAYWVYSNTNKVLSISQSTAENCVGDKAFDASRYSTIYQGNKMQSKALQVLACIRTWCTVELEVPLVVLWIQYRLSFLLTNRLKDRPRRSILPLLRNRNTKHLALRVRLRPDYSRLRRAWNRKFVQCCLAISQNIRGTIYSWAGQQTGAFYQISTAEASATFDLPQSAVNGFDANRESSIFAGDKLQPAALQCLPCIKL